MKPKKTPHKTPHPPVPATLKWAGWTDTGRVRKNNEDAFLGLRFDARDVHRLGKFGQADLARHHFTFAVCDGMGGAQAGEYASEIAVDKITTLLPCAFPRRARTRQPGYAETLTELFTQIHHALAYLGDCYEECHGMQTTMSLCWFTPGWMYFGHVGDSRIYHLPRGANALCQLTEDDTHVGWLFRNGKINEREARQHPRRNVLQKALGGGNQFVTPQTGAVACAPGDIFLLCTDGLTEGLYDHSVAELLRETAAAGDAAAAHTLVTAAVRNDGRDNTTALVVQVV